jgi:hypothetical protein
MIERGRLGALFDAEAGGEGAGRDVADHHLQRDDLDLADQLLAHVQPADEVGRHADFPSLVIRNSLMRLLITPLPVITPFFWVIERRGVVLEVLDDRPGLRAPRTRILALPS